MTNKATGWVEYKGEWCQLLGWPSDSTLTIKYKGMARNVRWSSVTGIDNLTDVAETAMATVMTKPKRKYRKRV